MPEREVKLAPAPGFRLPALDGLVDGLHASPPEVVELDAVYHDTPDLRLARAGASLRYRAPEGWTVKLPDPTGEPVLTRREHRFPGAPGTPPASAVDLVRALVRTARVEPVARLRTRRTRVELRGGNGTPEVEVCDDEVSVLDGSGITSCFRELEVELAEGAPESVAERVVAFLRAAGGGHPDPTPKITRALGPAALAPADVAVPRPVPPDASAAVVIRAALAASVVRLVHHDPGVRIGDHREDVHQARVATRRLRSDLRTFAPLLDGSWPRELRAELKWLATELGAVRDTEVLLDLLRDRAARVPELDRHLVDELLLRLVRDWEDRRVELLVALRSPRYAALLDRLVAASRELPLQPVADAPAAAVVPRLARRPWRRLRAAVRTLGAEPSDPALHEVRIRVKRARYAAEAVAPAAGPTARRFARALARVQDVLGEQHDAVVAIGWLRDAATSAVGSGAAGATVFAAGMVAGILREDERAARERWRDAWQTAARKRLRQWM